jgi:aminoglycoside phosphotransferase (APT) family kinase protein
MVNSPDIDQSTCTTLLNHIAPDHKLQAIDALTLGFVNRSFRLIASLPDSSLAAYIVKQYSNSANHVFGQEAETRAAREYKTLTFLQDHSIPCPEPVFFDLQGAILGSPILVTKQLPGRQILAHPANPLWAEQAPTVAALLARIHMLACPPELIALLPDATTQATWFLKDDTMPDYMQAYPDGESVWQIIRQKLPKMQPVEPGLVHGDYWSGNILWESGRVTGILDWENVAFGEPGFDVANCRMEMIIDGMDEAADSFLSTYESSTGKLVANLGLCELAVAVQPMWQRAPFLTTSPIQERFRQFVANAKKRV